MEYFSESTRFTFKLENDDKSIWSQYRHLFFPYQVEWMRANERTVSVVNETKKREIKTCLKFDGIRVMLLLLPQHDWTNAVQWRRQERKDTETFFYSSFSNWMCALRDSTTMMMTTSSLSLSTTTIAATATATTATTVMGNDEEPNRTVWPSGRQAGKHNNNQPRTKSLREPNTYKLRDISGYIWCVYVKWCLPNSSHTQCMRYYMRFNIRDDVWVHVWLGNSWRNRRRGIVGRASSKAEFMIYTRRSRADDEASQRKGLVQQ